MAAVIDTRLRQAQTETMASRSRLGLIADELRRRRDRLLEHRHKLARLRHSERSLDTLTVISQDGESRACLALLIIDDLGIRKLPHTATEDLLELFMRRYERASTLLTSNRPVDDCGKLLGDTAAVAALLNRLLHHAHVLKCGPAVGAQQRRPTCAPTKWGRKTLSLPKRPGESDASVHVYRGERRKTTGRVHSQIQSHRSAAHSCGPQCTPETVSDRERTGVRQLQFPRNRVLADGTAVGRDRLNGCPRRWCRFMLYPGRAAA